MRTLTCMLLMTCFLCMAVAAAEKDPLDKVLEHVHEKLAAVRTLRTQYTDTVFYKAWETSQAKSGRLTFMRLKENGDVLLHMEQLKPITRHVYLAPDKAVDYEPDNHIAHVVKLDPEREPSRFRRWMDLVMDPAALREEYTLSLLDDEEIVGVLCRKVRLTPAGKEIETDYKEMTLWIDPELGLPRKIEGLSWDEEEIRTLELATFRINPRIRERDLRFDPPKGVDIDEVDDITF